MSKLEIRSLMSLAVLAGILSPGLAFSGDAPAVEWPKDWTPQSTTTYPPYPDVWGRENPGAAPRYHSTNFYDAGGDDPLIKFNWSADDPKDSVHQSYQEFFSGKTWTSDLYEFEGRKYYTMPKGLKNTSPPATTFPDHSYLETWEGSWRKKLGPRIAKLEECVLDGFNPYKNDTDGNLVWRRIIIRLLDAPRPKRFQMYGCSYLPAEDPDGERLEPLQTRIWSFGVETSMPLKDGTVLARVYNYYDEDMGNRYVVRFDADLRSPFLEAMDDVYILDYEEIVPILIETGKRLDEPGFKPVTFYDQELVKYLKARGHRH